MDDIKFPSENQDDNLSEDEVVDKEGESDLDNLEEEVKHGSSSEPASKVKITFGRFVSLVANHSFLDIVEKNSDEEVIISTNLLTDLANAHDGQTERKLPVVFVLGLIVGIGLTYLLLTKVL
ncbi:MAG: hypothetical protein ACD_65C00099G0002 [uncultured bacterium]|nr:MAG: hypothetical protein ACD_65C00099G0002 [uncultured bacterium]KKT01806.1 MAG: hypothetical protein UV80_C0008G0016 [Candidatus Peregrinibacteria bacterium GW2011_GWF2_43_17]HAU39484.1 hypothetical protein [Candidatus Peregrinibacteria bacterium]